MNQFKKSIALLFLLSIIFTSCGKYYKSVMFKYDKDRVFSEQEKLVGNYKIEANDRIKLRVYTLKKYWTPALSLLSN